jgi:hypothetical protein
MVLRILRKKDYLALRGPFKDQRLTLGCPVLAFSGRGPPRQAVPAPPRLRLHHLRDRRCE